MTSEEKGCDRHGNINCTNCYERDRFLRQVHRAEAAEQRAAGAERKLERALSAAAKRIGELEEAIADVADGFEQQGKRGLASQLRQFLPSSQAPHAVAPTSEPAPAAKEET